MLLRSLKNQLLRDIKAHRVKSGVLGVLLLVGLYLWIPPLWRLVQGGGTTTGMTNTAGDFVVGSSLSATTPTHPSQESTAKDTTGILSWKDAQRLLASDPLLRSAEPAANQSDPFHIDADQLPPPILFAEEETSQTIPTAEPVPTGPEDELTLKSTIVGVKRRAAYINRKLYFEGTEFDVRGVRYRLVAVYPRRVVLNRGRHEFELTITK